MGIKKAMNLVITTLCVFFVAFHIYTAAVGALPGIAQRAIHLGILLTLFFLKMMLNQKTKLPEKILCVVLLAAGIASLSYVNLINETLELRAGITYTSDIIFGLCLLVALLYSSWRAVGLSLTGITIVFVLYAFLGMYMPGLLAHAGMKVGRFVNLTALTTNGVFGAPLYASASQIALFVILGSIFTETGVGDYFTSFATALFGKMVGGPAKVAVVASGFFGSINGSAVANVIGTGTFTIPMMKRAGFDDEFAGAVEAVASTGGQIMPPIMGTTAFIAAEMLGISYWAFAKAAIIPAILYYVALLMAVDLYARKYKLKGTAGTDLPELSDLLKNAYLFSPLILLIVFLAVLKLTITRAGIYTIAYTVLISCFRKQTRITFEKFIKICKGAANGMISVGIACGTVGIIIAVVQGSGLSYRLSSILTVLANGHLALLLILTMLCSIILGMGVPTAAAYMILAVLVAPAITKMGVPAIAAHLFVFYFGVISNITPPVALAAYAAAGISKGSPSKTGWKAFKLAISGFILPFMIIYNPVLLFEGSALSVLKGFLTACLGVYCLSCFVSKAAFKWSINLGEQLILLAASLLLIDSGWITDVTGLVILGAIFAYHYMRPNTELSR